MFRKTLITTATFVAVMSAVPAFADVVANKDFGGGTINFTGSVTNAPCSIDPNDEKLTVKLGQVSMKQLSAKGDTSDPVDIKIHLNSCQFDVSDSPAPDPDRDYAEYCEVAEETGDPEMKQSMNILDQFFPLPDSLKTLWQQRVEDEREADVTVCTAHRSKGLEWDTVKLYDDFADILDPEMPADKRDDELNLLYVATTRARRTLVPGPVILEVLAQPPAEDILSRRNESGGEVTDSGDSGNDSTDGSGEARDVA